MIQLQRRAAGFPAACMALVAACGLVSSVSARPPHKKALADYLGPFLRPQLNDCRTCHVPDRPGEKPDEFADKPHNPFGARLKAVRQEMLRAGKKTDIVARIQVISDEDSDGDGVANLLELLTGRCPGEPGDRLTEAEAAAGRKMLADFVRSKSAYPWTPFETVSRPPVSAVKDAAWMRNPIDAFLAAEHEARGLRPRPEAPKPVLLRRVHLDLIGLPPTPAELHAFLADESPNAYEKVVDRLLADPRHGERWGRHWMDVWRYSDWAGYGQQVRDSQPHIWRWRDWLVESVNADRGYDRMVLEMLAADELAPEDPGALRATGYLVRNYKLLSREKWLQDTVEHTAQAFLGLTLGCARCHDHMYDPITQKEYYQVRAVFEPHRVRIDKVPGQLDTTKDGLPRVYDADLDVKTYLFVRGDDRAPDKTKPMDPGVPEALGGQLAVKEVGNLPVAAACPDRRDFVVADTLAASEATARRTRAAVDSSRKTSAAAALPVFFHLPYQAAAHRAAGERLLEEWRLADLDAGLARLRHEALQAVIEVERLEHAGRKGSEEWGLAARKTVDRQRQAAVVEATRNLQAAERAARGGAPKGKVDPAKQLADAKKALAQAEEALGRELDTNYTPRALPTYPDRSTGRRLAFARWIADRDNPLAARVAMNHIWLRHFGQALVPSVFDFGRNGRPPLHPALLDWLAAEFMDPASGGREALGWSMKHLHRLIVTSSAYRMASTPDEANLAIDRDNKYLWRIPPRRLEAEAVRDCVFFVAGRLDPAMGGADIDHNLGLSTPRRSIYFRHAQEKQMEFLKLFDLAAATECYQRKESVVPQQSLALFNSELTRTHARLLARELAAQSASDPAAFTTAAFERVLSRPPTAEETAECVAFLKEQTRRYSEAGAPAGTGSDPALRARESLVHVLMNHHDFVTVR